MGVMEEWDGVVQNRLRADGALSALVAGVYTGVAPQADDSSDPSAFPYLLIDDTDFVDYSTGPETGFEIFMRIYTYDRQPGRKRTRAVQDAIFDSLHRQGASMSVTGHTIVLIDREGSTVDEPSDADGEFRGVCEYRAIVTRNDPL